MGFVTILRPHLTDLEYRSKKAVLRASAGRSGIGPSPRMPRPKNSTGGVPEDRGEKPDSIIGSSEPWRGKSIETSNAQIQARPDLWPQSRDSKGVFANLITSEAQPRAWTIS